MFLLRPTLWRLSARRQPSAGAAWLAEPRFPTRVYAYGSTALPFFYSTTELPVGDRKSPGPRSVPLATKAYAWLHEVSDLSAGPADRQVGRSEAEAKLHRSGTGSGSENIRSELRSNSRAPTTGAWHSRCLLDHDRSGVSLRLRLVLCRGRRPETSAYSRRGISSGRTLTRMDRAWPGDRVMSPRRESVRII